MNAEIFSSYRDLLKLKDRWDGLYSRAGGDNMALTWEWHEALCRAFHRDDALTVVSFEDRGEFVGIAPLIRKGQTIHFLSNPLFSGYMDFLILRDHETVFDCLLDLLGSKSAMRLHRIRHGSPTLPALEAVLRRRGAHWHRRVEGISPYVPAPADFPAFLAGRPKPLLNDLRHAEKKLDSLGSWTFVRENCGRQAQKILETLFQLDGSRVLRGGSGHPILGRPDDRAFSMDLLAHYHRHLGTELSGIWQGGKFLSCALGLSAGGRYYHWLMASDRSLRRVPLAKLHLARLMDAAFRGGCSAFDFMAGDEAHKFDWSDCWEESHEVRVFPGAAELYLHKACCTAQEALHAVRRSASPSWRRVRRKTAKARR